jgi:hypothetical protein
MVLTLRSFYSFGHPVCSLQHVNGLCSLPYLQLALIYTPRPHGMGGKTARVLPPCPQVLLKEDPESGPEAGEVLRDAVVQPDLSELF